MFGEPAVQARSGLVEQSCGHSSLNLRPFPLSIRGRGVAGQIIGRRKQKSFEGFRVRRDIANQFRIFRRGQKFARRS